MNNKGQSLVIFVLILPLILALMGICIDIGIINSEKRKIENNVKSTITYGLNNIEDKNINNKMRKLLVKNIGITDKIQINNENGTINITVIKHKESIFNVIIKKMNYEIKSSYKGYIENDKIQVIKG